MPYDPEPDIVVIREAENPDPRYADRFYLAAEVLSESDRDTIEVKLDICRDHPTCCCVLLIRQDRTEITVHQRTADGWTTKVLLATDTLALPEFGLSCNGRLRSNPPCLIERLAASMQTRRLEELAALG